LRIGGSSNEKLAVDSIENKLFNVFEKTGDALFIIKRPSVVEIARRVPSLLKAISEKNPLCRSNVSITDPFERLQPSKSVDDSIVQTREPSDERNISPGGEE
jgi:hypothetical protein